MKKAFSLILCLCLCLSLFACGKAGEPADTATGTTGAQTSTEQTTAEVTTAAFDDKVKANGYCPDLLPVPFPAALPEGITAKYTTHYTANAENNPYDTDFFRLRLVLAAVNLPALNALMNQNGWTGVATTYNKEDDATGLAESDWMEGFWKQEGYAAVLTDSSCGDRDGLVQYTVSMDIVPCTPAFPAQLSAVFPAFDGVCLFQNQVFTPAMGSFVLTKPDRLAGKSWRWEFNGKGVFIGVTKKEAQAYLQALRDAGFITNAEEQENIYGSYTVFTAEKTKNNKVIYGQFLYSAYAKTLMALYTNDYDAISQ